MAAEDVRILVSDLVASHGDRLRRFLLVRVRNGADVADIVQEVYLRMLRISDAESIRSPEAYLFTVAHHVLQQCRLGQSKAQPFEELTLLRNAPYAFPNSDPALEVDAQECLEELQNALDELPPKMRATFLMHRRDGMSLEEIGAHLGITCSLVKKYLARTLMQLRQRLERAP